MNGETEGGLEERRIAIVRDAIAALNRGDWDAALVVMAPEFEYDLTRTDSPLRGVHSRERMRAVMEEFLGSWKSARYEPGDPIFAGERVVMPFTTRFLGRDGLELETQATWVWTFRGEQVVRLALYQDRAEALADATVAP